MHPITTTSIVAGLVVASLPLLELELELELRAGAWLMCCSSCYLKSTKTRVQEQKRSSQRRVART